ncbi:MAG: DUF5685 family protein [Eubacteriales bacterium]
MFGYIHPRKCELRVHEYETYKAYYCGLCKTLLHTYSAAATAVVNFDCTFLYLLGDSLASSENQLTRCKCLLHPVERKMQITVPAAAYPAAVNVLLAYYKIKDDVADGKAQMALVQPFLVSASHRAAREYPATDQFIKTMNDELGRIQAAHSGSIDEAAHPFAHLLGTLFRELSVDESENLYGLGYNLGRWIYIIDAADDIQKDIKNGSYNVFAEKYGDAGHPGIRREAEFNLFFSLAKASEAYARMSLLKNKGILDNILYLGLKERTNIVLKGESI